MKTIRSIAICAVFLAAAGAYASCPNRASGLIGPSGITSGWYDTFDTSCASTDASTAEMSCYTWPSNSFTSSGTYASYSMVAPTGSGHTGWQVSTWVDFNDSTAHSRNALAVTVRVWHNSSISYSSTFFFHDGTQGTLECTRIDSSGFTVADGDTVEVIYSVDNYDHATIRVSSPVIFEG